jgi:lysozyme family protein
MTADDATFLYVDIAVLLGVLGLLMILAGWAAAKGRLKRNYVIGMRTSAIMRSDETWRVAHKKCAWSFWSSGGVLVAGALLLNVLRPPARWSTALLMVMTALVGVIVLVGAVQAARTVDHEAPGQDRK